jgi:TPR repeat protein
VPSSHAKALSLCRKAAEEGAEGCQTLLGHLYSDGKGVPQDYVEAHKWYNLAATLNVYAVDARDKLALKMTPTQIAEAQRLAREWKPKK